MSIASSGDVDARLRGRGPLTPAEIEQVATLLEDAESLIRDEIPDLDVRVASDEALRSKVIRASAWAVARVMQYTGLRSKAVDLDDFSRTDTMDGNASADLFISESHWDSLLGRKNQSATQAFTIIPGD